MFQIYFTLFREKFSHQYTFPPSACYQTTANNTTTNGIRYFCTRMRCKVFKVPNYSVEICIYRIYFIYLQQICYHFIKNIHYGYDNQYNKEEDNRYPGRRFPLSFHQGGEQWHEPEEVYRKLTQKRR